MQFVFSSNCFFILTGTLTPGGDAFLRLAQNSLFRRGIFLIPLLTSPLGGATMQFVFPSNCFFILLCLLPRAFNNPSFRNII